MTAGTIEEKIYHRQIYKQFLVNRVLKDPKQRRFFKSNDLYELFTLSEATEEGDTETSAIFAGTGSDIKVTPRSTAKKEDKTPKCKVSVFKPDKRKRKEADGARKDVSKSLKRLYQEDASEQSTSELSVDLREKLREQARRISAKFVTQKNDNGEVEKQTEDKNVDGRKSEIEDVVDITTETEENEPEALVEEGEIPDVSTHVQNLCGSEIKLESITPVSAEASEGRRHKSHKHKSHKHKHKKHKHKKLDGERVEGLVKARRYKPPVQDEQEQQKTAELQDNYVLSKLFSKSGVIGGIQHDSIMEDGTADYVLVESEATDKAKRAVAAMKASRQECSRAETGVPNWTGNNGGAKKPKFGTKKKGKPGPSMSSTQLLALMKNRNSLVSTVPADTEEETDLFRPDHRPAGTESRREETDQATADLLADIRNFVAFQARADGEASTAEVVAKFQRSLPSQQSPLFKAFLQQICHFRRDQEGRGIWSLKAEFR